MGFKTLEIHTQKKYIQIAVKITGNMWLTAKMWNIDNKYFRSF